MFTWRNCTSNNITKSDHAGGVNSLGYVQIGLLGVRYLAHRLAFLYMTGSFPLSQVDHINHDRSDNRWKNLRGVTQGENKKNTKRYVTNKTGIHGVSWKKAREKWFSRIHADGQEVHVGCFDSFLDACCARKSAELKYGYHENHGVAGF